MALVAPSSLNVLFAPAAGPGIGGGHVMRCLTLVEALVARGARCAFAVNVAGAALADRFGDGAFSIHPDELPAVLEREAFDVLVLDDYAMACDQEEILRRMVKRLVVIDDLANRPHLADLLVDPGYGRRDADYAALMPAGAVRLMGPDYALVKPAFTRLRAETLHRPIADPPRRLFMSFGLSDIDQIAARAVAAARRVFPELALDVALALDAVSVPKLIVRAETDPNLHLHLDAANVAELMAGADLAVGAGGSSTWERACLGLPTLAVIVADNQRAMIESLASNGALLAVDLEEQGFEGRFAEALIRLCSLDLRASLRSASAAHCDGRGADRIADAILAL